MNRKLFNRVVRALVPHTQETTAGRRSFVQLALYGSPLVEQLDYSGDKIVFCTHLVERAITHGRVDGEWAVVLLLEQLKLYVGEDRQRKIDALIADVETALNGNGDLPEPPPPPQPDTLTADDLTRLTLKVLPPPFAWIAIPGGWVALEGFQQKFRVEPFFIAKYPVTNAQFAQFMSAGGYEDRQWWGDGLWEVKQQGWMWDSSKNKFIATNNPWTEPLYWNDSKWNGADYPVVGVSWYEAVAFTNWLNHTVGTASMPSAAKPISSSSGRISLPMETQWQRAAQGDDARKYPYGSTFDKNRANTKESGIGRTTPVTYYEGKGDSPYGVVDMSGNVREWCLNTFDDPGKSRIDASPRRVLRGGSWISDQDDARAASRLNYSPNLRNLNFGFRLCCVRAPSL